MDELSDHLFAGAALASDHHGRVSLRNASREFHRTLEGGRSAEEQYLFAVAHVRDHRSLHLPRLPCDDHRVRRSAEQHFEMRRRERLGEIVPRARA